MEFLAAPMEGITFSGFRRVHHSFFPGADAYYAPFISPDSEGSFKPKFLKELTSDASEGYRLVPQILTNRAEPFNITAGKLADLGFKEVNLNLGCPSGTVFAKNKGAALLGGLEFLQSFLDGIFASAPCGISIKMRMGVESTAEFPALLELMKKYPLEKLIVHARARSGYYESEPDLDMFAACCKDLPFPVSYNGNVYSPADLERVISAFPALDSVMIGRGIARNPALIRMLKGGNGLERGELREYHEAMTAAYLDAGLSPVFTAARMKELWHYMDAIFPGEEKTLKALFKTRSFEDFRSVSSTLLSRHDPENQ